MSIMHLLVHTSISIQNPSSLVNFLLQYNFDIVILGSPKTFERDVSKWCVIKSNEIKGKLGLVGVGRVRQKVKYLCNNLLRIQIFWQVPPHLVFLCPDPACQVPPGSPECLDAEQENEYKLSKLKRILQKFVQDFRIKNVPKLCKM